MKKLTLKSIITAIITSAILVTGLNPSYITIATAATTTDVFTDGDNITLKPGDTKRLIMSTEYRNDNMTVGNYTWSSSDTNIVKLDNDIIQYDNKMQEAVIMIAKSAGTATITGKYKYSDERYKYNIVYSDLYDNKPDLTLTITVEQPKIKMTAKQKKCKHKYKTTRKATCELTGVKTCKKCKWQKTIKKTDHKWVECISYGSTFVDEQTYDIAFCMGCNCPNVPKGVVGHDWHAKTHTECTTGCTKVWTTQEYGSDSAMWAAIEKHLQSSECNNYTPNRIQVGQYNDGTLEDGPVEKHKMVCEYCGTEKKDK